MTEWRGIEAEACALCEWAYTVDHDDIEFRTEDGTSKTCAICEHTRKLLRRAIAHGLRVSAREIRKVGGPDRINPDAYRGEQRLLAAHHNGLIEAGEIIADDAAALAAMVESGEVDP